MQMVLFPEGLVYDGEAFRTPITCLFFRDLERSESEEYELVAHSIPSWNQIGVWLQELDLLRNLGGRQDTQLS